MAGRKFESHGLRCYILSRLLPEGERRGYFCAGRAQVIRGRVAQEEGKDVWLIGGGELTREFLKDDLVDELSCET